MKQKTGRYLLSLLFALAMVTGLLPGTSVTAWANDGLVLGETDYSVKLNPSPYQVMGLGRTIPFKATFRPDDTTDQKVKWSVDNGNVKLYTNEACTTEVGTASTSALTVYAKGVSAGTATVTVTSNADSEKTATCTVKVARPAPDVLGGRRH